MKKRNPKYSNEQIEYINKLKLSGLSWDEVASTFNSTYKTKHTSNAIRKASQRTAVTKEDGPKILLFDIETAPILSFVWGLWDQNIGINQIEADWHLLSWSAKWLGDPESEVMYMDQRNAKNIEDDKEIVKGIWKLLDESDITISQNGIAFDHKKLNTRFLHHGFPPPSSCRKIDTLKIVKKHFAFSSNKLAFTTEKLCTKYKKLDHAEFSGFELWKQCMSGNKKAWDVMEKYNKHDVLALEELYLKLIPWDNSINFNVFREEAENVCTCGSKEFRKNGFAYTNVSKFQRYVCKSCGKEFRDRANLLSKEKRDSLKR